MYTSISHVFSSSRSSQRPDILFPTLAFSSHTDVFRLHLPTSLLLLSTIPPLYPLHILPLHPLISPLCSPHTVNDVFSAIGGHCVLGCPEHDLALNHRISSLPRFYSTPPLLYIVTPSSSTMPLTPLVDSRVGSGEMSTSDASALTAAKRDCLLPLCLHNGCTS